MVQRGHILLACAEGESHLAIAKRLGISPATVGRWRRRRHDHGIEGLQDKQRRGRPRTHGDPCVAQVLNRALQSRPSHATHGRPYPGPAHGHFQVHRPSVVPVVQFTTPSPTAFQDLQRSLFCR